VISRDVARKFGGGLDFGGSIQGCSPKNRSGGRQTLDYMKRQ